MKLTLESAIAAFGAKAKAKLSNLAATGRPEDQIRAPFEHLLGELGHLCHFPQGTVAAVGESSIGDLKTRPDYAVSVYNALVGFIELKAPGKGADPRKFRDPHDKAQWEKLRALPNLVYTDGNAFSLWQDGELVDSVVAVSKVYTTATRRPESRVGGKGESGDERRMEPFRSRTIVVVGGHGFQPARGIHGAGSDDGPGIE